MCGIVGGVSTAELPPLAAFARASALIAHRGPDDSGSFAASARGAHVRLEHRRLSILDLTAAGRQPMASEDDQLHIAFNGEIYNYVELRDELAGARPFRTRTDTEVILRAYEQWGSACFRRLNGMFAIALWDGRSDELMLARDRAGMKPIYYYCSTPTLLFASELKALRAVAGPRPIDLRALFAYFDLGYLPGAFSIDQGVRKLEQGSLLRWRAGQISIDRFWEPPEVDPGLMEVDERFAEAFARAAKIHTRSDVEIALFLSGGLDSACLLAALREASVTRLKTFTVGFPGMGHYDERPAAAHMARAFGSEHRTFEVTEDARAIIPELPRIFGEPFADASAIPTYFLSKVAAEQVKVVLTGTGADDLLAGYRKYHLERYANAVKVVPGVVVRTAGAMLGVLPATRRSSALEEVLLARRFLRSLSDSARARYLATLRPLEEALVLGLFTPDAVERSRLDGRALEELVLPQGTTIESLHGRMVADFFTYLSGDLLVKEDRLAMHFGLEGRLPFLDADLAELCLRLPDRHLLGWRRGKLILRRWAEGRVPKEVLRRKKHGFGVPMAEWLRGPLRGMAEEAVETAPGEWFDREAWRTLLRRHLHGHADLSQMIYNLIVFCAWLRHGRD